MCGSQFALNFIVWLMFCILLWKFFNLWWLYWRAFTLSILSPPKFIEPKGQLLLIDGKTEDEVCRNLERVLRTMRITTSEPKVLLIHVCINLKSSDWEAWLTWCSFSCSFWFLYFCGFLSEDILLFALVLFVFLLSDKFIYLSKKMK